MIQVAKLNFKPVVRNVQNQDFYYYLGGNKFQNIRTGKEGMVSDEVAARAFKINLEAMEMINEFPLIAELIKTLNLKFDNN